MRLDRKISFYEPVEVKSPTSGAVKIQYKLLDALPTVYAEVTWPTGKEGSEGKQTVAVTECMFGIRYKPEIDKTMIIEFEGLYFDIISILPQGRRQYQHIKAEQKDNGWSIDLYTS